jgi:DNA-binding NarL/FixJ family response regulator
MDIVPRTDGNFDARCLGAMMSEPIQVLIADGSEVIRRAIHLLLQTESSSIVGELSSFTELVAALKSMKPDVVLMDLHMPGKEEADKVRETVHRTCLIAMSRFAGTAFLHSASQLTYAVKDVRDDL